MSALLQVDGLRVRFDTADGVVHAVDGISYSVAEGETLGIVGESGCGKSVAALTLLGLSRGAAGTVEGTITFRGRDLARCSEQELRSLRGNEIAMVFQDSLSSLHPFYRIGAQLVEAMRAHNDALGRRVARARAVELLGTVGIADAARRIDAYPHELSGGMRQRVMIAMALANAPKLLIADEPTTALDVTVQAQILALLARLREELGMALILITHDLGVLAQMADRIAVMYCGRIVEEGPASEIFSAPQHPYTWGLLGSIPSLAGDPERDLAAIEGRPPSLINRPPGCHFHPRCPYVQPAHRVEDPVLTGERHRVACLLSATAREALRQGSVP